jgi:hypothetical protein
LFVSLTDKGWGWLADHLDADLSSKSPAGNLVLQRLLGRLKEYLGREHLSLADLIVPAPPPTLDGAASPEDQVVKAYLSLSKGQTNVRVRLAALRSALPSIPPGTIDEVLLGMTSSGKASLYRLDNPAEIRDEDREAVLRTPSGEERHIVYLGGRGS